MRAHPIFTGFTSGELSPTLYGRTDFAKYPTGAQVMKNFVPRPQGPARRRPGTRFVAETKFAAKAVRVLPFEFSTEQAYVLEMGEGYIRFFRDGGRIESPPGTPVEVVTTYLEADLASIHYVQNANELYLFHPSYHPKKLTRQSHTAWTFADVDFQPPATAELGFQPAADLTLSATSGNNITVTASASVFLASDVGRQIQDATGRMIVRAFSTGTSVTADVVKTFAGTSVLSGTWTMLGSPVTTLTPSAQSPEHAVITLTLAANGWRSTDVGRFVRVHGGVCRITEFTSATAVRAEVLTELTSVIAAIAGGWSVEDPTWNATRGFPATGTFFEQRLVLGGSKAQPNTFWGSVSASPEVFALAANDDDAYEYVIAANDVNTIRWLVGARVLLIGTAGQEFTAFGGNDEALTPTNVRVRSDTAWGAGGVQPIRVNNAGLFVSRFGKELREFIFSFEQDAYRANDLLLLAEHLTRARRIVEVSYQRRPHSIVWAIGSDGVLLALTYQREHEVLAWSRQVTGTDQLDAPLDGKFESVATIPHWNGEGDVSWFVIRRDVGGSAKRYIEYFDEHTGYYGPLTVDSGLSYSGAPVSQITAGLAHLEGEIVEILADGSVRTSQMVTGGAVTITDNPASTIDIGLPFYSVLRTMRPEVPNQGTSQGRRKHYGEIFVRFQDTLGGFVNDDEIAFRSTGDLMDTPPPLFSGDRKVRNLGRDTDATITIEQRQPLPMSVVAVFGTIGVGD
jgi:hypothetical protein